MNSLNSVTTYLLSLIFILPLLLAAQQKEQPNILIIISDDHAYQTIGAYGSPYGKTPGIDRIAEEGMVFNSAYVTNSICGPSRATILTGKYSHKNGFKDNETSRFDHSQDLFVKQLREVGYKTAWIGKQHLGNEPQGFDFYSILPGQGHYFNPDFITLGKGRENIKGYVSDVVTDKSLDWLSSIDSQEPFCLVIGHKATHRTWMPAPEDFGLYDTVEFPIPETFFDDYNTREAASKQEMSIDKDMILGYDLKMFASKEEMRKDGNFARMSEDDLEKYYQYYAPIYKEFTEANLSGKELALWKYNRYMTDYLNTAHSMDKNIERVLDYLDEHDLTENTLVIYLSDQGFYMGEHGWFDKRFMYEESFRTPMVARYPKLIKPGSQSNSMVMNVDIAPTLLELAGANISEDIQGISFAKTLSKPNKKARDHMYYHYYERGEHAVSPHFGVSDGRYKLIRYYDRVSGWELFDVKKDPQELNNIYGEKKIAKKQKELEKLLLENIVELEDNEAKALLEEIGYTL